MNPGKKFPAEALRNDYNLMREILERFHPALYWYTSKDSMDYFFDKYFHSIKDSMTRQEFGFSVLAPVTTKIHCGHTSFNFPRGYSKRQQDHLQASFPFFMKIWPDTMVVTFNLNKKDSILKYGTIISHINGYDEAQLTDTLFQFMPTDGYAENVNYVRLSAAFPFYFKNILGLRKDFAVGYIDSTGEEKTISVPLFDPSTDSAASTYIRNRSTRLEPHKRRANRENIRTFEIDTAHTYAEMTINSFGSGGRLHSFYRRSFRKLRKANIPNLIIDLRLNGGGRVNNYTALARYIRNTSFKVADSAVAKHNGLGSYKRYFKGGWLNSMVLFFTIRKAEDNEYHFRYWEKHFFRPHKRNFYNGRVFVLISGPTFSAATLFAHGVKGQENVLLIGEEAGGGAYGNSGILIPEVVLPNTKMKVRMPLFRLVQYLHGSKNGRGVIPDICVPPTVDNIRKRRDGKMEKALEIIQISSTNP